MDSMNLTGATMRNDDLSLRVAEYNKNVQSVLDDINQLKAKVDYNRKAFENGCKELSNELGYEVNEENIRKVYEELTSKMEQQVDNGMQAIKRIKAQLNGNSNDSEHVQVDDSKQVQTGASEQVQADMAEFGFFGQQPAPVAQSVYPNVQMVQNNTANMQQNETVPQGGDGIVGINNFGNMMSGLTI